LSTVQRLPKAKVTTNRLINSKLVCELYVFRSPPLVKFTLTSRKLFSFRLLFRGKTSDDPAHLQRA
jgi:hypothetical protein